MNGRNPTEAEATAFAEIEKRAATPHDDSDVRQAAAERVVRALRDAGPVDAMALDRIVDKSINDARNDERRRNGRDYPHVSFEERKHGGEDPRASPLDVLLQKEALAVLSELLSPNVAKNDNVERGLSALLDSNHGATKRVAAAHRVSPSMVSRDKRDALAWLRRQMQRRGVA